MSKWLKNEQKCPKMPTIQHYSTVFDFKKGICFLYKKNGWPVLIQFGYRITKPIIFLNQIICPSLVFTKNIDTHSLI